MKNELKECLISVISIAKAHQTYEIGQLSQICKIIDEEPIILQNKQLEYILNDFLVSFSQESRKNQVHIEFLSLMIIESLIFNIYTRYDKNASNSFYNTSTMLSTSQLSMSASEQSMISMKLDIQEIQNSVVTFVEQFVSNEKILKRLKNILERHQNKSQNQRYLQILLETLWYILNKESKNPAKVQKFQQNKTKLTSALSKRTQKETIKQCIQEVNEIIFSSRLNRIIYMLTQAHSSLHFALHRIYFCQNRLMQSSERKTNKHILKYFQNIKQNGKVMIYNICKYYIDSIGSKNELFEESKNPLYKFISTYFQCFCMPIFRIFSQVVGKCCKVDYDSMFNFYQLTETIVMKDLVQFIENLPFSVVQFLHMLYQIIENTYGNPQPRQERPKNSFILSQQKNEQKQGLTSTVPVKKLLLYSFLVKPNLIEMLNETSTDLQKYEEVCNFLLNLFFTSSIKKYSPQSTPIQEYQLITHLTQTISSKLDDRIIYFFPETEPEEERDVRHYSIQDPMLNYDYEQLFEWIKKVQFTPKDLREFPMQQFKPGVQNRKATWGKNKRDEFLTPRMSPMLPKLARNLEDLASQQKIQSHGQESPGQLETDNMSLLTWMSVGGSCNYAESRNRVSERKRIKLKKFQTFERQKIKEVEQLYEQYKQIVK